MNEKFLEILNQLQELAPEVFEVYLWQVEINAYQYLVTAIIFAVISVAYTVAKKKNKDTREYDQDVLNILTVVFYVITLLAANNAVIRFANPAYYAIRKFMFHIS